MIKAGDYVSARTNILSNNVKTVIDEPLQKQST